MSPPFGALLTLRRCQTAIQKNVLRNPPIANRTLKVSAISASDGTRNSFTGFRKPDTRLYPVHTVAHFKDYVHVRLTVTPAAAADM
jgi:hypothetical protein